MIRPLSDNVLLKPIEKTEQQSSIILTTVVPEKIVEGEVLAIGNKSPNKNDNELLSELEVGDHVLYESANAVEIKVDNESMFIIAASKILCAIS